jgi:hypothetical protein
MSATHANVLLLSDAEQVQRAGVQRAIASLPDAERELAEFDVTAGVAPIMKWVGSDQVRAQQALDAENETAEEDGREPRSSLVKRLERVLAGG